MKRRGLQCLKLTRVSRIDKELLRTNKRKVGNKMGKWSKAKQFTRGKF